MKLKDALKSMPLSFSMATTFQVVMLSLGNLLWESDVTMYLRDLFIFPLVGILCSLPILLLVRSESAPRWELFARRVLHMLLTGGLALGALTWFGWITLETLWWPVGIFLVLYTVLTIHDVTQANRVADQINAQIDASHDS